VAAYLGAFLHIPVLKDGLTRGEETAAQRSIEGRDRLANLEGAFRPGMVRLPADGPLKILTPGFLCRRTPLSEAVCGKRVILLDDIYTTGATVGECARVLRTAGAKEVHCAAVAAARKR
jgi:predicted amidophosphoribosyltransferase